MTPPRIIRLLLLATACAWGNPSFAVFGAMGDKSLPLLISDIQQMSPYQREVIFISFHEELSRASISERQQRRHWIKKQMAALSPEQREQMRRQIREHWQRMSSEQRERMREMHRQEHEARFQNSDQYQERLQRLTPEQREEFHQWLRIRRGGSP